MHRTPEPMLGGASRASVGLWTAGEGERHNPKGEGGAGPLGRDPARRRGGGSAGSGGSGWAAGRRAEDRGDGGRRPLGGGKKHGNARWHKKATASSSQRAPMHDVFANTHPRGKKRE